MTDDNFNELFFTSDLHLGDPRLDIFYRDFFFRDKDEMSRKIIDNFNSVLKPEDALVIVGDACFDEKYIPMLGEIKCKYKFLVKGNYDEDKLDLLEPYFYKIYDDKYWEMEYKENDYFGLYITHKPQDALIARPGNTELCIVGHIHSLWKVQKFPVPMVNVSVDCWNFKPVSYRKIFDVYHAIKNYYDSNVFFKLNEGENYDTFFKN